MASLALANSMHSLPVIIRGESLSPEATVTSNYAQITGTPSNQRSLLIDFTNTGVTDGWYSKLVAFWIFTGSSVANKCFNMVDPRDLDGAFRLTLSGTVNNHANGLQFVGGSGWAQTYIDPSLIAGAPYVGAGSQHDVVITNCFFGSPSGTFFKLYYQDGSNLFAYPNIGSSSAGIAIPSNTATRKFMQRKNAGSNQLEFWENGALTGSETSIFNSWGGSFTIELNRYNGTVNATTNVPKYAAITKYLTPTELASYDTALSTLVTGLGR